MGGGGGGVIALAARHIQGSGRLEARGGDGYYGIDCAMCFRFGGGAGGGGAVITVSEDPLPAELVRDVSGGLGGYGARGNAPDAGDGWMLEL
jgi:hypothetical protein